MPIFQTLRHGDPDTNGGANSISYLFSHTYGDSHYHATAANQYSLAATDQDANRNAQTQQDPQEAVSYAAANEHTYYPDTNDCLYAVAYQHAQDTHGDAFPYQYAQTSYAHTSQYPHALDHSYRDPDNPAI